MTPNQLRLRAPGFKDFHHIPLRPCSGFKASKHFSFSFFFQRLIGLLQGVPTLLNEVKGTKSKIFLSQEGNSFSSYKRDLVCTVCDKLKVEEISLHAMGVSTIHQLLEEHNANSKTRVIKLKLDFSHLILRVNP